MVGPAMRSCALSSSRAPSVARRGAAVDVIVVRYQLVLSMTMTRNEKQATKRMFSGYMKIE